jgi:FtsP/CotA-like multicopper oxidase with cupredoxin domain
MTPPESVSRRELLAMGLTGLVGSAVGACQRSPAVQWLAAATPAPSFVPDVELAITARPGEAAILPGGSTEVWRYTATVVTGPASTVEPIADSYLGPTLRLRRGQKVRIRFSNRLPDPSIVHWHGMDVPATADGHPRLAIAGGADYVYEFEVTNRAGTYWYHPHPDMQTGPQVYRGLAGLLVVSDDEEDALELPAGAHDLACVLQDRRFDGDNQLVYSTTMMDMETGFLGDRVLINGRPRPNWALATSAYRIRVVNGSNARVYKLAWSDGTPMTVIGTDGGLLPRPVSQRHVTLGPAQRSDLWLDLSGRAVGTTLELRSEAFELSDAGLVMGGRGMGGGGMGGRGMGRGMGMGSSLPLGAPISLVRIEVTRREASARRLPERLSALEPVAPPVAGAPVRRVPLSFQRMQWLLGGRVFGMDDVAQEETVVAGSTHIWELTNVGGPMGMQMAHPIHLHGRQFRVIGRTGGSPSNTLRDGLVDGGMMDTVLVLPDETVRIQVTFSTHPGLFLYHCHILEHEDMGMMRNYRIVPE